VISEVWPYDLERQLELALKELESDEGRIVSLLGAVIEQSSKAQDDGIVRFFLRRLDSWRQWDDHWDLLEPFLAHCAVQFPHSFDYVARVIAWRKRRDREIDGSLWWDVTQEVLSSAAAMARDSEVLWALWLTKELGKQIGPDLAEAISGNNGPWSLAFWRISIATDWLAADPESQLYGAGWNQRRLPGQNGRLHSN